MGNFKISLARRKLTGFKQSLLTALDWWQGEVRIITVAPASGRDDYRSDVYVKHFGIAPGTRLVLNKRRPLLSYPGFPSAVRVCFV